MIITGAPCLSPSFQDFTQALRNQHSLVFFQRSFSRSLISQINLHKLLQLFWLWLLPIALHIHIQLVCPHLTFSKYWSCIWCFTLFEVLITWALCNKLFDHPGGLNYQMGDGSWIMFLQAEDWARFVKRVIEESILWLRALPPSSPPPPPCSSSKSLWFSNVTSPFRPVGLMTHNLWATGC